MNRSETAVESRAAQDEDALLALPSAEQADALARVLRKCPAKLQSSNLPGVVIAELIAITDDGQTALILYPGQPDNAALRARSVVDLRGGHIGKAVTLVFENGDAALPIVTGVLRTADVPLPDAAGQVEVDADGKRLVVQAREQLVLRCGKASITLTRIGKVLIDGSYVQSRSTGMNRLKGGAVQIN